jgi:hypothetical protein
MHASEMLGSRFPFQTTTMPGVGIPVVGDALMMEAAPGLSLNALLNDRASDRAFVRAMLSRLDPQQVILSRHHSRGTRPRSRASMALERVIRVVLGLQTCRGNARASQKRPRELFISPANPPSDSHPTNHSRRLKRFSSRTYGTRR